MTCFKILSVKISDALGFSCVIVYVMSHLPHLYEKYAGPADLIKMGHLWAYPEMMPENLLTD